MSIYAKTLISVLVLAGAVLLMHEFNPLAFSEKAADLGNFLVVAFVAGILGWLEQIGLLRVLFKYTGITWLVRELTYAGAAERLRQELSRENAYHKKTMRELNGANAMITSLNQQIEMDQGDIERLIAAGNRQIERANRLEEQSNQYRNEAIKLREELAHAVRQVAYYKGDANKHRRLAGKPRLPSTSKDKAAA